VKFKNVGTLAVRLVALALVVAIAPLAAACGEAQDGVRDPEVTGTALAEFTRPVPDFAVGQPAPEARGTAFDGSSVSITNDGRAKALVFLAHW
jgi:hypothetical protein